MKIKEIERADDSPFSKIEMKLWVLFKANTKLLPETIIKAVNEGTSFRMITENFGREIKGLRE